MYIDAHGNLAKTCNGCFTINFLLKQVYVAVFSSKLNTIIFKTVFYLILASVLVSNTFEVTRQLLAMAAG